MDTMELNTPLARRLVNWLIRNWITKKLGINAKIDIRDLIINFDGEKARLSINVVSEMEKDELEKIFRKAGL